MKTVFGILLTVMLLFSLSALVGEEKMPSAGVQEAVSGGERVCAEFVRAR